MENTARITLTLTATAERLTTATSAGLTGGADVLKILAALAMNKTVVVTVADVSTAELLSTSAHTAALSSRRRQDSTEQSQKRPKHVLHFM